MILFLTAGFGDGHNTAARNVAQAFQRLAPSEPIRTVDIFDDANPVLSRVLKTAYQILITRLPGVWSWTYQNTRALKFSEEAGDLLWLMREALAKVLRQTQPRAAVSTYPLYARMLEQIRRGGGPSVPLYTVVTDSISIHPMWVLGPSDRYYVADEDSAASLADLGVAGDRIQTSGFPVSLDFMTPPVQERGHGGRQRILYLPSTEPRHVQETLEVLRPLAMQGALITLPVGKHMSRLFHIVRPFVDGLPNDSVEVIGWTNRIPSLLQTHDLVICKAGGAILHEALAARCPAIIDFVVPGQEEGNAQLLTSHGCGLLSHSPRETGEFATALLANGAERARRMSDNARAISEPDAAMAIAQDVLTHLA